MVEIELGMIASPDQLKAVEKLARKQSLGLLVLSNSNNRHYKEIIFMLHNTSSEDNGVGNKEEVVFMERGGWMCCHPRSLTLLGDCVTKYVPTYVPIFTGHRAIEH